MKKYISILGILISLWGVQAQTAINGTINSPEGYAWVHLYGYAKGNQILIAKAPITKEGAFTISLKENTVAGVYRLNYHTAKKQYIDLLIENKQPICITIDPYNEEQPVSFCGNSINTTLQAYYATQQQPLTNLSILYEVLQNYAKKTKLYKVALKAFKKNKKQYTSNVDAYSQKNKLLHTYLRYKAPYFVDPTIHTYLQQYNAYENYFANYSILDTVFVNSPDFQQVVVGYLRSMQQEGEHKEISIKQYKTNVDKLMHWAKEDEVLQEEIAKNISYGFKQMDMEELTQYIDENYLAEQCDADENTNLQKRLATYKRLAKGKVAPSFSIEHAKKLEDIHATYTIVAFWASWCGPCKAVLPSVHQYIKTRADIQVVAIGLDEEATDWNTEKEYYPNWIHVRAAKKWEDQIAIDYGIHATPTFFVLDKEKKIIGKYKNLRELKEILE